MDTNGRVTQLNGCGFVGVYMIVTNIVMIIIPMMISSGVTDHDYTEEFNPKGINMIEVSEKL